MKKGRLLLIAIAFIISLTMPFYALSKDFTRTAGKDILSITKITPRSGAYLPVPINYPIYMEVKMKLTSAEHGEVVVNAYRLPSDTMKPEYVMKSRIIDVKSGTSTININTPYIVVDKNVKQNEKLIVSVSLFKKEKNGKKIELARSESMNMLAGSLKIYPGKASPSSDNLKLLGLTPKADTEIKVNKATIFTVKMAYGLKTRKIGYISVLFYQANLLQTGSCWLAVEFGVPQGSGNIELETAPLFFPAVLVNQTMGINILLRVDPLGGTVTTIPIKGYPLVP